MPVKDKLREKLPVDRSTPANLCQRAKNRLFLEVLRPILLEITYFRQQAKLIEWMVVFYVLTTSHLLHTMYIMLSNVVCE